MRHAPGQMAKRLCLGTVDPAELRDRQRLSGVQHVGGAGHIISESGERHQHDIFGAITLLPKGNGEHYATDRQQQIVAIEQHRISPARTDLIDHRQTQHKDPGTAQNHIRAGPQDQRPRDIEGPSQNRCKRNHGRPAPPDLIGHPCDLDRLPCHSSHTQRDKQQQDPHRPNRK
jgi:hypothetical protein